MEKLPAEDGYETEIVRALAEGEEVVIPYFEAATFVDSIDQTRAYVVELIEKYDLYKIGDKYTVYGGRYTPEHGHHYWVRMGDPKQGE
jgi:hypothetical protein